MHFEPLESRSLLTTFVVDSVLDVVDSMDGVTTLREAITAANTTPNGATPDHIEFNIPGAGPHTIQPTTGLPWVTDPVVIDGYTQLGASPNTNPFELGSNATLLIEIDGSLIVTASHLEPNGLTISGGSSTVRGLVINRFAGSSQTGTSNGILLIGSGGSVIEGNLIGTNVDGTMAQSNGRAGVEIRDSSNNRIGGGTPESRNVLSGQSGFYGVNINGGAAQNNNVMGNYIGTDITGTLPIGNRTGVLLEFDGGSNTIGGPNPGEGNVISGSIDSGLVGQGVHLFRSHGNTVQGNLIGTDATGTVAMGNRHGVHLDGADNNLIGGTMPGAGNVISANINIGVFVQGDGNALQGNYIGTDINGTAALGNGLQGVRVEGEGTLIGGTALGAGNVISGNDEEGISLRQDNSVVQGNLIGTDASGTTAIGNGFAGILVGSTNNHLIGGLNPSGRNVISGNGAEGIRLQSGPQFNTIQGNYIGTNLNGDSPIPNLGIGVSVGGLNNLIGGVAEGAGNVISGNAKHGILIGNGANENLVQGNLIGTDATGTSPLGNLLDGIVVNSSSQNLIGGDTPEARNVISGHETRYGVHINGGADDNTVQGNYIGTDITGSVSIGNSIGVLLHGAGGGNLVGGSSDGEGNLISGNSTDGVLLATSHHNLVQGNLIGTDASGTISLENVRAGLSISGSNYNTVGGRADGEGNIIAFNSGDGVYVGDASSISNNIVGNSIHSNGELGIDVGGFISSDGLTAGDGVTPNDADDADTGPNNLQNFPIVTLAEDGATTHVVGSLNSLPNAEFTIDFYVNAVADPAGHGEGERYLGSHTVTTDPAGNADFDIVLLSPSTAGEFISATATGTDGTSEFSGVQIIEVSNTPPTAVAGGPYLVDEGGSIQLDASATVDAEQNASTLDYVWDLDEDGVFGEVGAAATNGDETGIAPIFSAADLVGPDSVQITLRVTDNFGLSDEATTTVTINDATPPVIESVDFGGDLQSFIVQLNDDDLDGALAENTANYRVTAAGADEVFGTGDDVTLAVSEVDYDASADRILVQTVAPFFDDVFRLEIDGDDLASDGTAGITDLTGNFINDGDFTADFDLRALALIEDLLDKTEALGLNTGAENSLTAKLDAALQLLGVASNDEQGLLAKLNSFIDGVDRWYDQGEIRLSDRDELVDDTLFILFGLSL